MGERERACSICGKKKTESFYPDGTLKKGDAGDAVTSLQQALNDAGYDCGKADGSYGSKTVSAVTALETANGLTGDGIAWPCVINLLHGDLPEIGGDDEDEKLYVQIWKEAETTPANGSYYVEGEGIRYRIDITNCCPTTKLRDVTVYDPMYTQNDGVLDTYEWLAQDYTCSSSYFVYIVTADDVERGYIDNTATVTWYYGNDTELQTEYHTCRVNTAPVEDEGEIGCVLTLTKDHYAPDGRTFYTVGETITYHLSVKNDAPYGDITNIVITDPLYLDAEDHVVARIDSLGVSEQQDLYYYYDVTEEDAERGYIRNRALAEWVWDGESYSVDTDYIVEAGYSDSGEDESDIAGILSFDKGYDDSDGHEYYTAGETITYHFALKNNSEFESDIITDIIIVDPLYTESEDRIVAVIDSLAPGNMEDVYFDYIVTEDDVERGYIYNNATADFVWNGNHLTRHDEVTIPTGPAEGESDSSDMFYIDKWYDYSSMKEYFTVGETILYVIDIFNQTAENKTATDVFVYDPMHPATMDNVTKYYETFEPGKEDKLYYEYVVTEEDAERGYIENTATLNWTCNGIYCEKSATCIVKVLSSIDSGDTSQRQPDRTSDGGYVAFTKNVSNSPANGAYFVEGETIYYALSLSEVLGFDLIDVEITDPLKGSNEDACVDRFETVGSGEFRTAYFAYTVTKEDAERGYITNTATVSYRYPGDTAAREKTASCTVDTGVDPVDDTHDDFHTLTKTVTSTPANGEYYVEGETVTYEFTFTSTCPNILYNLMIYDPLYTDDPYGMVYYTEACSNNSVVTCSFDHIVTASEAADGTIINQGRARFVLHIDDSGMAYSDYVVVKTGIDPSTETLPPNPEVTPEPENPDVTPEPPNPEVTPEPENPDKPQITPPPLQTEKPSDSDACKRSHADEPEGAVYTVDYCTAHGQLSAMVESAIAAADTNEMLLTVYLSGEQLWKDAVDSMIQSIMSHADEETQLLITAETESWQAFVDARVAMVTADQDELTAHRQAVTMWENRCTDLCELLATMPAERAATEFLSTGTEAVCGAIPVLKDEERVVWITSHCSLHTAGDVMINNVLAQFGDTVPSWRFAENIWKASCSSLYAELPNASDDSAAFTAWVSAREALLTVYYAENPVTAVELTAEMLRDNCEYLCNYKAAITAE